MAEGGDEDLNFWGEDGYDRDGYDRDGKTFEQSEGEHIPLLPRTSTSKGRETLRPFKPLKRTSKGRENWPPFKPSKRTSTRSDISCSNPSYNPDDGEMETSFGGDKLLHSSKDPRKEFNNELRADVKRLFPKMSNSVQVDQIDGRLSVRLFGDEKWSPVYNKNGKISIQLNKELKQSSRF